ALAQLAVFVLLPTLVAAIYFGLIATPRYETEVHLSVRSAQGGNVSTFFGSLMGASQMGQSIQDTRNIADYMQSHDAVRALDDKVDLRAMFSHGEADYFSRLPEDAPFEK